MPRTSDQNWLSGPRRRFLSASSALAAGSALEQVFGAFLTGTAAADPARPAGFGPLHPVKDATTGLELLQLPDGFRYLSYGWQKDPLEGGQPTPGAHDGMAVIAAQDGVLTLCRNHEVGKNNQSFAPQASTYDPVSAGGCTNLQFDTRAGKFVKAWASISGTVRNCAGGPTPWGSWLTCEETVVGAGQSQDIQLTKCTLDHGWIFEVPAKTPATGKPLKDMGRFVHEAVAVDPKTGYVYETEDAKTAGFYRFIPNKSGQLTDGGQLWMMRVTGQPDLRGGVKIGSQFPVTWVRIEDPHRAHSPKTADGLGVYSQGKEQGGTTFARLEGCWYGEGKIYLNSTSGGAARKGQVWEYDPAGESLRLVFESPSGKTLENPDNITVSPRGGLVLCEDGDQTPQRLHGLTRSGQLFTLAAGNVVLKGEKNGFRGDYRNSEWCGACFSPDGQWLFVNLQEPGITLAITGPWQDGGL